MYNVLGFIVALIFIRLSLQSLNVSAEFFMDEVATMIVFGGTLAATIITFPPRFLWKLISAPLQMMRKPTLDLLYSSELLIQASSQRGGQKSFLKKIMGDPKADAFLKEGIELLLLGLARDDFKNIVTERIYRGRQRDEDMVNLFRRLAKYPPAFGLVGTVLGLISLMRSVGAGADASQIGLNMALALTATLYGLAFSNFVLAPVAENFQRSAEERKVFRELLFEGLLMLHDEMEPLAVQEMLNSYLEPKDRVDVLGVRRLGEAS
jgi:chemotaxis protein MotA